MAECDHKFVYIDGQDLRCDACKEIVVITIPNATTLEEKEK